MSRSRRLERIEDLAAQRQHQAELEDLEALAESARERLLQYLQAHRDGSPLPALKRSADCGTSDEARGARERLRARLDEMGQRLRRYAELRDMYGIR